MTFLAPLVLLAREELVSCNLLPHFVIQYSIFNAESDLDYCVHYTVLAKVTYCIPTRTFVHPSPFGSRHVSVPTVRFYLIH